MEGGSKKTILRIELWHGLMLLTLLATLGPRKLVEPGALLIGGLFNFLLLSFGIAWVLTPLAGKGRVKAGVGLLVFKMAMFLGLLTTLFFRFELHAISFALGFSTLLLAILLEAVTTKIKLER
jgi:apolipoprotein N-acyltransferase